MRLPGIGSRIASELAPSVIIDGPEIISPSRALRMAEQERQRSESEKRADAISVIAEDVVHKLFTDLGKNDGFYINNRKSLRRARKKAAILIPYLERTSSYLNRLKTYDDVQLFEDFQRDELEADITVLATQVVPQALEMACGGALTDGGKLRYRMKNNFPSDSSEPISAYNYAMNIWAPQYAHEFAEAAQLGITKEVGGLAVSQELML